MEACAVDLVAIDVHGFPLFPVGGAVESGHDPVLTSSGVDDRVNQFITGTLLVHRRRPDRQKKS